ncbi:MAG: prefoldin subunit beta [Nitrososphaerota archaeon]|nr:prefoldin subunit beta [Nitrososphaerota archaeon]
MSNPNEAPPWLREQLARYDQLQQNLQSILVQKQQVDQDSSEVDRAIVELKKASENDMVYKSAGNILVKAKKEELMKELEERKELSGTRSTVLAKQEQRVRESIKELSTKLEGALKSGSNTSAASSN